MTLLRRRLMYLALACATIVVGLLVHLRGAALGPVARDVIGDALWGMMIAWLAGALAPRARLVVRSAVAYAFCAGVEVSQLYHAPAIDAARATMIGHLVLGSGFDSRDLVAYGAGVVLAALLESMFAARRRRGNLDSAFESATVYDGERAVYSLWRAGIMLGRIIPELPHDAPSAVIGILQPTAAFSPELALTQSIWADLPGRPAWQRPIPQPEPSTQSEILRPRVMSAAELQGIPAEQLLELRDDTGRTIPTQSITVMELDLGDNQEVARLCAAAGVTFSGWYVSAGLAAPVGRAL